MKRWVAVGVAATILMCLLWCAIDLKSSNEPSFNGRPLRSWLREFDSLKGEDAGDAIEAVNHIGTNSLPTLLAMVRSKDSRTRRFWISISSRQSFLLSDLSSADQLHHEAYIAFYVLKARGKSAVPELAILLRDRDADVSNCALKCLIAIGAEARPALDDASRDRDASIRRMAESALAILDATTETK